MNLLLGVNIDHVATLRQARYSDMVDSPNAEPSPVTAAEDALAGGADSITIHVRGDRRHMQEQDAYRVRQATDLPLNFEMGNSQEMIDIALKLKPDFVLDVAGLFDSLLPTVQTLQSAGIKISMFIDPDLEQVEASKKIGAEMIELHTGCFANALEEQAREVEIARLKESAVLGHSLGLQVNAGHGINYENVHFLNAVPHLSEFNIGHNVFIWNRD